jgi:hypothetical protein
MRTSRVKHCNLYEQIPTSSLNTQLLILQSGLQAQNGMH